MIINDSIDLQKTKHQHIFIGIYRLTILKLVQKFVVIISNMETNPRRWSKILLKIRD
jgi:hypothetical protein